MSSRDYHSALALDSHFFEFVDLARHEELLALMAESSCRGILGSSRSSRETLRLAEGRLHDPGWWLSPSYRYGDISFAPRPGAGIASPHGVLLTAADDGPAFADALVRKARETWGATGDAYPAVALADGHRIGLAPTRRARAPEPRLRRLLAERGAAVVRPLRRLHLDAAAL